MAVSADPNQITSSGYTLEQVKQKVANIQAEFEGRYPESDINQLLAKIATDYGTTLDAVNECPVVSTSTRVSQDQPKTAKKQATPPLSSSNHSNTPSSISRSSTTQSNHSSSSQPIPAPNTTTATIVQSGKYKGYVKNQISPDFGGGGYLAPYDPAKDDDPNFHLKAD